MFRILQESLGLQGMFGRFQCAYGRTDNSADGAPAGQAECEAAAIIPAHNIGQQYFNVRSQLDYPPLSREICCPR